ncbi:MAG: ABC transporter ATP-binding protein [Theionarchaea archaeon]|nr:ABC transporter ATP-binding protein [Theionarchaea archaeon]
MRPIITVENLSKTYVSKERTSIFRSQEKKVEALRKVNLAIGEGEIFGLLGPNGAGKTTLIKCLTTLLLPTEGTATINGHDLLKDEKMVRASIGCMLMGERGLYWKLTGRENLEFFGSLYYVPPEQRKKKVEELIHVLNLTEFIDRTVETYSTGQKMKLAFAKSLIHEAPILILDEPTVTMDVRSARELRQIVKELNEKGITILYTTHLMQEAEELCDRVAIIDRGEVIALGTPEELKGRIERQSVTKIEGIIPEWALEEIQSMNGVKEAVLTSNNGLSKLVIVSDNSRVVLPQVIKTLFDSKSVIEYISPEDITLEDVFISLTGRALSEDTVV